MRPQRGEERATAIAAAPAIRAVSGAVTATDYLELQAKARVNGDVVYRTLEMHVGAIVQGKLIHAEPETASIVELKRARGE